MNIKYLKYFVAVAECGSINQAARKVYVSQPHLSYIIKEIEEEAGFPLLSRRRDGISLTPQGELYLHHCRNILAELDAMEQISAAAPKPALTLHVSMTRFTEIAQCFTAVCKKYQAEEAYSLRLKEDSAINVLEDISSGYSDIGILHFSSQEYGIMTDGFRERDLYFRELAAFRPYIAVSSDHELIRRGIPVTPESVAPYGLIRYIGEYEDFFYRIFAGKHTIDLTRSPKIISVNDREAQLRLLAQTDCYTIGIQNFTDQARRYHVVCSPVMDSSERLVFGLLIPNRKKKSLTAIESDFIKTVRLRFTKMQDKENSI